MRKINPTTNKWLVGSTASQGTAEIRMNLIKEPKYPSVNPLPDQTYTWPSEYEMTPCATQVKMSGIAGAETALPLEEKFSC